MQSITAEIICFLAETKIRQSALARESGVSTATISRIAKGHQKDMRESKAMEIRLAMRRLSPSTPAPAPPAATDGRCDAAEA